MYDQMQELPDLEACAPEVVRWNEAVSPGLFPGHICFLLSGAGQFEVTLHASSFVS